MKTTCGLILVSAGKLLLVHATKQFGKPDLGDGRWGFPKGLLEAGENLLDCAIREVKEETGFDLKGTTLLSGEPESYRTNNKQVYMFIVRDVQGELQEFKFHCESLTPMGFPEVDDFVWKELDIAIQMVSRGQSAFLQSLKDRGILQ